MAVEADPERPRVADAQALALELLAQGGPVVGVDHQVLLDEVGLELLGGSQAHQPALVEDADPVCGLGLLEVVGGEHQGGVIAVADLAQVLPEAAPAGRVEPGGRLVQEEDAGTVHQASDDLQLPHHPARHLLHRLEDLAPEAQQLRQVGDLAAVVRRHHAVHRPVGIEPVEKAVEPHVLLAGEVLVDARFLEDDPHLAAHRGGVVNRVGAADPDRAGGRGERRRQDRDGGRLAGPVGPQQAEELAWLHLEGDSVDGVAIRLPVALDEVFDLDHGLAHDAILGRCGDRADGAVHVRQRRPRGREELKLARITCWRSAIHCAIRAAGRRRWRRGPPPGAGP